MGKRGTYEKGLREMLQTGNPVGYERKVQLAVPTQLVMVVIKVVMR